MTLSPSDDRRTEGVDGPKYDLNIICAVPGCDDSHALQRHHMWRKSDVIGDKWWVLTKDGQMHGNCVNLCRFHHREITDNIARIVYHEGMFWWKDVLNEPILLLWQPPGEQVSEHLAGLISDVNQDAALKPIEKKLDENEIAHVHHLPDDVCPTCLRKLPQPKSEDEKEKPKVRKTWSVAVPMDQWEDGANTIDEQLKDVHLLLNKNGLPYGEGKTVKFYILTTSLGLFIAHADELMSDG